jgi:hypothetical protein
VLKREIDKEGKGEREVHREVKEREGERLLREDMGF